MTDWAHCLVQLNLRYNPISNIEVVSVININNISIVYLNYYAPNRPKKYNPKVYIGSPTSYAESWNYDETRPNDWPENLFQIK